MGGPRCPPGPRPRAPREGIPRVGGPSPGSVSRPSGPPVKYHYSDRFFTDPVRRGGEPRGALASGAKRPAARRAGRDPLRGQCQVGSLTGAVHLSNRNAGVLRRAQGGQKPPVEQKGKSSLDLDFQYEYRP